MTILGVLITTILFNSCSGDKQNEQKELIAFSLEPYPLARYDLFLNEDSLAYIYEHFDENIYIHADLKIDGQLYENVKLRIRGDSSRKFDKKSLKIKLDKGSQLEDGADKINLNAEYIDKTMMQQFLASKTMNDNGQICFRSGYVPLYINGQYFGLYLRVENMDDTFLKSRNLSSKNNLYKATHDYACMVSPVEVMKKWEKKTNSKIEDKGDLKELIEDLRDVNVDVFDIFAKERFYYEELVNIIAINMLICNASTYYHNYYMYHDLDEDKWRMMPWDLDKTFNPDHVNYNYQKTSWAEGSSSGMNTNTLIEKFFANENTLRDVRSRVLEIEKDFNSSHYKNVIDSLQAELGEYVLKDNTNKIDSMKLWNEKLTSLLDYIDRRPDSLIKQIDHKVYTFMVDPEVQIHKNNATLSWSAAQDPHDLPISYTIHYALNGDFKGPDHQIISNIHTTSAEISNLAPGNYQFFISASNANYTTYGHDIRNAFKIP